MGRKIAYDEEVGSVGLIDMRPIYSEAICIILLSVATSGFSIQLSNN